MTVDPSLTAADTIAVVILNWNNCRLSLDCIASLERSVGVTWHAYLVDNASTDDSVANFADLGERVTLIVAPSNGGWTGGNNLGIRRALAENCRFIFVLNNDAQVLPDTLGELRRISQEQLRPAIIGPIHLSGDASYIDFLGATIDDRTGMPVNISADEIDFNNLPNVYVTSYIRGAAIFAQKTHFEQLGLFDDKFYLNYDETDWCFRARACGFALLMTKSAQILHVGSATIGGEFAPLNVYFLTRNALLFSERHGTPRQRLRFARKLLHRSLYLQPYGGRGRRILLLLFGKHALARASRAGVRDYILRRFGNCPSMIRTLRS